MGWRAEVPDAADTVEPPCVARLLRGAAQAILPKLGRPGIACLAAERIRADAVALLQTRSDQVDGQWCCKAT